MFISDWRGVGWGGGVGGGVGGVGVEILIGNNYLQMEAIGAQNYKAYFETAIIFVDSCVPIYPYSSGLPKCLFYVRTDLRVEKFWISLTREQSLNFNRQIAT